MLGDLIVSTTAERLRILTDLTRESEAAGDTARVDALLAAKQALVEKEVVELTNEASR